MSGSIYKNYWRFGFKTRLYDLMSPLGYLESILSCVERLKIVSGDRILDVGCGTGAALPYIAPFLKKRQCEYTGIDILPEGLRVAKAKAEKLGENGNAKFIQANISKALPFETRSFSKVMAHFSVYTLTKRDERIAAWRGMFEIMEPGGLLVAANPSLFYDPKTIIRESLINVKNKKGVRAYLFARFLYPFTQRFGLQHIKRQLDRNIWHAYSLEDFIEELDQVGFSHLKSERVYCGSGWLITAEKK